MNAAIIFTYYTTAFVQVEAVMVSLEQRKSSKANKVQTSGVKERQARPRVGWLSVGALFFEGLGLLLLLLQREKSGRQ